MRNRYDHREKMIAETNAWLNWALETLNPNCGAVLLLHRRDKLTREQIAATVGISVGMVKKHLAQGLAVCRRFQAGSDEK